jgi:hypothetical protein
MCTKIFVIALLMINCRRIWSNISGHWQEWHETPVVISSYFHLFSVELYCQFNYVVLFSRFIIVANIDDYLVQYFNSFCCMILVDHKS